MSPASPSSKMAVPAEPWSSSSHSGASSDRTDGSRLAKTGIAVSSALTKRAKISERTPSKMCGVSGQSSSFKLTCSTTQSQMACTVHGRGAPTSISSSPSIAPRVASGATSSTRTLPSEAVRLTLPASSR